MRIDKENIRQTVRQLSGGEMLEAGRKLNTLLDDEQFERAFLLSIKMLESLKTEQRGPALFAVLLAAQTICTAWLEDPAKPEPLSTFVN